MSDSPKPKKSKTAPLSPEEFKAQTQKAAQQATLLARKNGSTAAIKPPSLPLSQEDAIDTNIAPPNPADAMFYGLVGDVARAASLDSEINPVAAAAGFLSFLGAMVGRDVYFPIGDTYHHPRLFTLHIGRSSRGGKGEALKLTQRISREIEKQRPGLLGQTHSGGLSSREGLAMLIHDGYTIGRDKFEPIQDKRLWVIEGEFSNVLSQAKRDGNTLSPALRELWDGGAIKPATKSFRVWASRPHVGMAGAITPNELHSLIHARELSNGFANRFLMFWAERTREVPFPSPTQQSVLTDLAERTADVIAFALGDYPNECDSRAMHMSQQARNLYQRIYPGLKRPLESDLLSVLLERRSPHVVRLSMLFALCDKSLVIEYWHIEAALSWVNYSADSVRYVFADQAREAKAVERDRMAGQIAEFLTHRPEGATLMEVINDCFDRKATPQPINDVLGMMLADHRYLVEMHTLPRADGRPGRQRKVYRMSEKRCGVSGVSGVRATTRLTEDFSRSELAGVSSFHAENSANSDLTPPNSATEKSVVSRVDAGKKLTPLTPQQFSYKTTVGPPWNEPGEHREETTEDDRLLML